jgi:zeta-carotene desaturase
VKRRVAIIGAGLAGIAATMRLLEAGCEPVLIESRKRPGGRATSFVDPRSGRVLDNCQHVLLGCCTNLLDLYERLGVADLIEWHRTLHWTAGHGVVEPMAAGRLPAPLHLAGSFRRFSLLDRAAKGHIRRAMWRLIRLGPRGRLAWRGRTFAEFLRDCGQPDEVVRRFWSTIVVSACNLGVDRVAAPVAMHVFQDGFLANAWSYTMGLSAVPLLDLYDPAVEAIEAAGGALRLGTPARSIAFDGRRVTGVVTEDGVVEASAVIAAVPFDRLHRLTSEVMRRADTRLAGLDEIEVSPILAVHLHFDFPVMEHPHLVLVERGVDWLFNKGEDESGRQHVHAVISAADAWMDLDEAEIVRRVMEDVHHAVPAARGLEPAEARAVKEKRATFAATPEFEERRPRVAPGYVGLGGGGIENLFLAGDWCDTGWPATMEGAVRSGYAAAAALTGEGGLVDDVPPSWLARRLGLR